MTETEDTNKALEVLKIACELPFDKYAQRFLKIRTKTKGTVPFRINVAQEYLHSMAEEQYQRRKYVRIILLKCRQWGGCLDPSTKVLTADLKWIEIGKLREGDELVSCDESPSAASRCRKMATASVEKIWGTRKQTYRIVFDDGTDVVCSGEHRWLSRKSQTQADWRSILKNPTDHTGRSSLKVGDYIRSITEKWGESSLDDAWLGGMADGEGSFQSAKKSGGSCLKISQRAGEVHSRMQAICDARGYQHTDQIDNPHESMFGNYPVHSVVIANMRHLFRFMGLSRPTRFIKDRWWEGKRMPDNGWRRIVGIEAGPVKRLIDIQTSTGSFIAANGLVSHNSTYIQGRFYRTLTQGERGKRAMIVTHNDEATGNLFGMARRFNDEMDPRLKPDSGRSTITQIRFPKRDSSYTVATAGTKGIGHSDTIQMLHASEFAYWPNAEEHTKGVFQTVPPRGEGTEIWVESTGLGIDNAFFTMVDQARKGESDYAFAFVPWFWFNDPNEQVYYGQPMDARLRKAITPDIQRYAEAYDLSDEQLAFMVEKIVTDFGGGAQGFIHFKSQYPACPEDAFTTTGDLAFIDPVLVASARKKRVLIPRGPKIMGIDPAWIGKDRCSVTLRQGRRSRIVGSWRGQRTPVSVSRILHLIDVHKPDYVFIEQAGNASGTIDPLLDMSVAGTLGARVIPVEPSGAPDREEFDNKGEECSARLLTWLQDARPDIDDTDELQRDLCMLQGEYSRHGKWKPESKQRCKTRRKGAFISPDHYDSLRMTFAYNVPDSAHTAADKQIDPDRPHNWRAS